MIVFEFYIIYFISILKIFYVDPLKRGFCVKLQMIPSALETIQCFMEFLRHMTALAIMHNVYKHKFVCEGHVFE